MSTQTRLAKAIKEHEAMQAQFAVLDSKHKMALSTPSRLASLPFNQLTVAQPSSEQMEAAKIQMGRRLTEKSLEILKIRQELAREEAQPLIDGYRVLAEQLYDSLLELDKHLAEMQMFEREARHKFSATGIPSSEFGELTYDRLHDLIQVYLKDIQVKRGERYSAHSVKKPQLGRILTEEGRKGVTTTRIVSEEEYQQWQQKERPRRFKLPLRFAGAPTSNA